MSVNTLRRTSLFARICLVAFVLMLTGCATTADTSSSPTAVPAAVTATVTATTTRAAAITRPPCPAGDVRDGAGNCVNPKLRCPAGTSENSAGQCMSLPAGVVNQPPVDCAHDGIGGGYWNAGDNDGQGGCEYFVQQECGLPSAQMAVGAPPGMFLVSISAGAVATFSTPGGGVSSQRLC